MKKLNKNIIKQLIMEEIANPMRNTQSSNVFSPTLGSEYIQNYRNGVAPNNNNKEPMVSRPPYETGEVETHIEGGEVYVTQGKNVYRLAFNNDELTSGVVQPVGEFGFYIQNGMVVWHDSTPANVRNDADLCEQIMDYSGREK